MANYEKIIRDNLDLLYNNLPPNLERLLPGQRDQDFFRLKAFGRICRIQPDGITIGDEPETGVVGILITLYALHANEAPCWPTPFKAFRELPNSLPYVGAFATHTESILIPHVKAIEENLETIFQVLNGEDDQDLAGGDLSIIVRPLPKIKLRYIFYQADEDFPASATCLYSNNAPSFLPIDALADTGEYTSRKIMELIS
jgi:hypothetical protein